MEYKKWKRTTNRKKGFFLLALMAIVALTACGSSKERKMAPDSGMHHFREVEEVNLPEEEIAKADFVKMQGEFLFYTVEEEEAGKQKTGLYMVSMPDGEKTRLLDTMEGMEGEIQFLQDVCMNGEEVYLCFNRPDSVGEDGTEGTGVLCIRRMDLSGSIKGESTVPGSDIYYGMAVERDGIVYIGQKRGNSVCISVIGSDGNIQNEIMVQEDAGKLIQLGDGSCATAIGQGTSYTVIPITPEGMQKEHAWTLPSEIVSVWTEDTLCYQNQSDLYLYHPAEKTTEKYMNFTESGISGARVYQTGLLSDGSIAVLERDYRDGEFSYVLHLLKEITEEKAEEEKVIIIACLDATRMLEERVNAYNQSQKDYKIRIQNYSSDEMDPEDSRSNFTLALNTDSGIDMVFLYDDNNWWSEYETMKEYAQKGNFQNLYDLMDTDFGKNDLLPNICKACEVNGELAFLPVGFSVRTVIGRTAETGEKEGWSFEELCAFADTLKGEEQLCSEWDKQKAFDFAMRLAYGALVDVENHTCSFDSERFAEILHFTDAFPEEVQQTDGESSYRQFGEKRSALSELYMAEFGNLALYVAVSGADEKLNFIGYPSETGNGAQLLMRNLIGITNNCRDKRAAWDFIKTFYIEPDDYSMEYLDRGFSAGRAKFDALCEKAQKEKADNYFDIRVEEPLDRETVEKAKNMILNTDTVYGNIPTRITEIVEEETMRYFSGEKQAEETMQIIQNRVQTYLEETR